MTESLKVSSLVQASPNRIYSAWLDERQHSAFTGSRAMVEPWVGGRFSTWNGYAFGSFVELDTGRRIVMTWRSTDFPMASEDSTVQVHLEPVAGGTRVVIEQDRIPDGQADRYKKGWRTYYLDPMKRSFAKPGAMRAAIQAASKAGLLPVPGAHRNALLPRRGPAPASTAQRVGPSHAEAPAAIKKAARKQSAKAPSPPKPAAAEPSAKAPTKPVPTSKPTGRKSGGAAPAQSKASATKANKSPTRSKASATKANKSPTRSKASATKANKSPTRSKASATKANKSPTRSKASATKANREPHAEQGVGDEGQQEPRAEQGVGDEGQQEPRAGPRDHHEEAQSDPHEERSTACRPSEGERAHGGGQEEAPLTRVGSRPGRRRGDQAT